MMNEHKVPKKQWKKWGKYHVHGESHAQAVFNGTYEDILRIGQTCFLHPDTIRRGLSPAEFSAIAWNAAWIAAEQTQNPGDITEQVITVDDPPPRPSLTTAARRLRLDPTRSKKNMVAAGRPLGSRRKRPHTVLPCPM